ncbi:MAG: hypothetical protein HOC77_12990 [Chloroflexi bacterium]|jgi:hypothetical protein|nr:hypothetical protein [Chloroflexota bacterium]
MYKKIFLFVLMIGAISVVACSSSSSGEKSDYWDLSAEVITEHANTQTNLGPAPSFDPREGPAETAITIRLGELRVAAAEFNALRFRWEAQTPPSDFTVHYDLVTQLLERSNLGMSFAVQAFEEMSKQVQLPVPDINQANVWIRQSETALAEANAFASAANRERDRLKS